jgi:MFS family permease
LRCQSVAHTSLAAIYGANLHLQGNLKWRLVLWLQMICPGIVVIFGWLIPESPRWLVGKGRSDEALAFIVKYHANGDPDHPIVNLEMIEITESLKHNSLRSIRDFFDLRPLVRSRNRLYRLMLCVAMSWFGQFSGNNTASYFLPSMVENVGITSTSMKLILNAFYAISGWVAALIGGECRLRLRLQLSIFPILEGFRTYADLYRTSARLHDIVGRRKMLLSSCAGMVACLAIFSATTADYEKTHSRPVSSASIAFIFIFGSVFAVGFTPMQPIYPAEVLASEFSRGDAGSNCVRA